METKDLGKWYAYICMWCVCVCVRERGWFIWAFEHMDVTVQASIVYGLDSDTNQ